MSVLKARRSLKTLPRLPPSPFDRKMKPRRRIAAGSVHHAPRIAAVSVLHAPSSHTTIGDGETFEQFWPAVPPADDFHPALYMTIRDAIPPIADAETIEHAWVSARKALKVFTDICYRSYLDDAARSESTPIYAPDGTLQGLLLIPETSDTDRTPFYAPDGTLHGAAWRRLTVADMVDMFIPAPEPVAVVWTYLANDPALSSLPMPSSTVNYELNFVSTLGPRAEAVRLAGDGIDLKSAKLGRSQFNIGFLDLESASKGHQTRK
ncbi:hypothetical protein C8R44DRAFT_738917 [Mycena epipterygia]|nr:hypothetical protein C8R44DRAFT_738917 [Mycena epipterygia]